MDIKKPSKKMKKSDAADVRGLSKKKEVPSPSIEMSYSCDSPEFPSSQECFSVGWDWSGQVKQNKKPTIRVVERPVGQKNNDSKLLKCHRPRRLVRNYDPDMFDASVFADELRSLASDLKRVPESNSPVASPPHSSLKRRCDVSTPTSSKHPSSFSSKSDNLVENVGNSVTRAETSHTEIMKNIGDDKQSFNDLLDDSLGADLLKLTQDLEQDLRRKEDKTPKDVSGVSSSRRRNRLSLSSKKENCALQKSVCRRINVVLDENHSLCSNRTGESENAASKGNQGQRNNNNVSLKIDFDEMDEATLQSIEELEEKEMIKSRESISVNIESVRSSAQTRNAVSNLNLEEEDEAFNSPELLDMIEAWEKKETQQKEGAIIPTESSIKVPQVQEKKVSKVSAGLDFCDPQHESFRKRSKSLLNQPPSRKKNLSLAEGSFRCTPEEIEKKRQEAIKKRLQLKKRS